MWEIVSNFVAFLENLNFNNLLKVKRDTVNDTDSSKVESENRLLVSKCSPEDENIKSSSFSCQGTTISPVFSVV